MSLKRILVLGANGFIGSALVRRLLDLGTCDVTGLDISSDKMEPFRQHAAFRFLEADITVERNLVAEEVKRADVVLPLVAIATPALYVREPLRVFELDFEENLRVIRHCVEYRKRIVFPSTSEVYGMSPDEEFREDETLLVMGPIHKQRWIYATAKQLLDRVIWAYGSEGNLQFTIFRPFNWIGPNLDSLEDARIGSSRVATQFIAALLAREPIQLVGGGTQQRCFTYVTDGIDALEAMIANPAGVCDGEIINVGNPHNECTMRHLALALHRLCREYDIPCLPEDEAFVDVDAEAHYGKAYQDLNRRKPCIRKARRLLGWEPRVSLETALRKTVIHFIKEHRGSAARRPAGTRG